MRRPLLQVCKSTVALWEPAYQYVRLALLGDLMKERGRFEITDFWVIAVCPPTNTAYLAPAGFPETFRIFVFFYFHATTARARVLRRHA